MLRHTLALVSTLALPPYAFSQAALGHRVFGPLDGTDTWLVDRAGDIVHTWPSTFDPGTGIRLQPDGTLVRAARTEVGFGVGGVGGGVQRIAYDGTLTWDWRHDGPGYVSHHDVEVLPNGNVLMIAWDEWTNPAAIAQGRDPALTSGLTFRPDYVIEVQQTGPTTGAIVWEWHVMDHVIQDFDMTKPNFGVVGNHPELVDLNFPPAVPTEGDWNHINSIRYYEPRDWIVLSAREQNEIWVIDHSTTTAEAAGHTGGNSGKGGDLLYRWGNPQAYDAGTIFDQVLFGQHGPMFIPDGYPGAGNILVFNNGAVGGTAVWEITPPIDGSGNFILTPGGAYGPAAPVWSYQSPGLNSLFVSNAERLPNGNTLICSGMQSTVFEVTPGGSTVWTYSGGGSPIFHAHYVDIECEPVAGGCPGAGTPVCTAPPSAATGVGIATPTFANPCFGTPVFLLGARSAVPIPIAPPLGCDACTLLVNPSYGSFAAPLDLAPGLRPGFAFTVQAGCIAQPAAGPLCVELSAGLDVVVGP